MGGGGQRPNDEALGVQPRLLRSRVRSDQCAVARSFL